MCKCVSVVCAVLILLGITTTNAKGLQQNGPAEISHILVRPTIYHARTEREISTTRDKDGEHHSEVIVRVGADGEENVLDLSLNEEVIAQGHTISYQKDGQIVHNTPSRKDLDICQYSGTIRGKPGSWAAVSTCNGVRGVIYDGRKLRYIEPSDNKTQSEHYLFDHADLNRQFKCGVLNNTQHDVMLKKKHLTENLVVGSRYRYYKSDTGRNLVRAPYNANKRSRYVELVFVVDNEVYQASGRNIHAVHHRLKDLANIINSIYAPLNIVIALVGVEVWTEQDRIQLVANSGVTLDNFLQYRKDLNKRIHNDNAHLLTKQSFNDGIVGKAYIGAMCKYDKSGGVINDHTDVIGLLAATIAHEMGHNFGMHHDDDPGYCEHAVCPDEYCVMGSSSMSDRPAPAHWSSCSLKSLTMYLAEGIDYCLRNKPKQLFDSPTCGNGFVEPGEECDCGLSVGGERSLCAACCERDTCRLRANATCAAGHCCDLRTCRHMSAGVQCRAADKECDLPEYCTGHSEFCPDDVYKMDSTPCGTEQDQAYCAQGRCRSHDSQCKLLWGLSGENAADQCYGLNSNADRYGNCGYDIVKQTFKACAKKDTRCGMLQCRHLNKNYRENEAAKYITTRDGLVTCRTSVADLFYMDPGMVPNGAKCGDNKMCMNTKCVPVEDIRASMAMLHSSVCPSGCSSHGVCNSKGNCHCDPGFAPPDCSLPGPGGSEDSGPASDPTVLRKFMIAMYVIFLGILPLILLTLLLFFFLRQKNSYGHLIPSNLKITSILPNISNLRFLRNNIGKANTQKSRADSPIYEAIQEVRERNNLLHNMNHKTHANEVAYGNERKLTKEDIIVVKQEVDSNNATVHARPNITHKPLGLTKISKADIVHTSNTVVQSSTSNNKTLDVGKLNVIRSAPKNVSHSNLIRPNHCDIHNINSNVTAGPKVNSLNNLEYRPDVKTEVKSIVNSQTGSSTYNNPNLNESLINVKNKLSSTELKWNQREPENNLSNAILDARNNLNKHVHRHKFDKPDSVNVVIQSLNNKSVASSTVKVQTVPKNIINNFKPTPKNSITNSRGTQRINIPSVFKSDQV